LDDTARATARRALDLPTDAAAVSTVGRLTAIKQHTLFLDAVAAVHARRPHVLALIAGDGELRPSLEEYARRLGIADRVRWLGWRRDLATIYGATDVFLLTSKNEGTPVALIEAMASGVAAVSTRVGGVGDVIDSPDAGLLIEPGDTAGLAAGVTGLVADPARRRTMGAVARARVAARFSVGRLVADVARMYDDLLGAQ
jgi:glycosyltransferase involved in cell wall biosynthesis